MRNDDLIVNVKTALDVVDEYLALPASKETAELVKNAVAQVQDLIKQLDDKDKARYQHELDLKKQKMQ